MEQKEPSDGVTEEDDQKENGETCETSTRRSKNCVHARHVLIEAKNVQRFHDYDESNACENSSVQLVHQESRLKTHKRISVPEVFSFDIVNDNNANDVHNRCTQNQHEC